MIWPWGGETLWPYLGNAFGPGWGIILALAGERFWPRLGKHYGPGWGMLLALDNAEVVIG
jgi:hypothetical protein